MYVSLVFQLSNLGIMTARLLPALQECFKSEYVSVRIEAAMVSSSQNNCRSTSYSLYFQKALETLGQCECQCRTPRLHVHFPNPSGNCHVSFKSLSRRFGFLDLSTSTGKLCIFGNLGIVSIWSCFVSCLLFLLFYVSFRNLCSGAHRRNRLFSWQFLLMLVDVHGSVLAQTRSASRLNPHGF